jgi:FkbM family methyltransferase
VFIDKIFQNILNIFLPRGNIFLYKILFKIFKFFIKGPFILKFDFYFYAVNNKKDLSRWMLKNLRPWDFDKVLLINKIIGSKKSLFLDCGCNYGAYSIPIAKIKKKSDIISFDASKNAILRLEENLELNNLKNISYYNLGISNINSYEFFNDNLDTLSNSGSYRFEANDYSYKVKVVTLDHFLKDINFKKYNKIIIKLDLEGYELKALLGLKGIIKKNKPIIFLEFSRMFLKNTNKILFKNFLDKYDLHILDLRNNIIDFGDIIKKIQILDKKQETIGDYFILNKNIDLKKYIKI